MDLSKLEKALLPFERKLSAQERRRRVLGVKEVDVPTYERYIQGPVKRFDSKKNAFAAMLPENPYGEEFREIYEKRTGVDSFSKPLPYKDLDPEDRVYQALASASWRLCTEYYPEGLPVTPAEGRFEVENRARMSRLVKKVGMWLGAEMVRITRVDQRWVYSDREVPHKYAVIVVVPHYRGLNETAPSHLSGAAVGNTYSRLKFITTQLTDFFRGLGYDAAYRETLGWDPEMLIVPMAIDAGIGEFARTGRVLSPEFGINMRLKAVTTDLPLQVDKPISFNTRILYGLRALRHLLSGQCRALWGYDRGARFHVQQPRLQEVVHQGGPLSLLLDGQQEEVDYMRWEVHCGLSLEQADQLLSQWGSLFGHPCSPMVQKGPRMGRQDFLQPQEKPEIGHL